MPGKNELERASDLALVNVKRTDGDQDIGFNSRPFVLCGMPYRPQDDLTWKRKNGNVYLKIHGSEEHGLPYGQDRILPIWIATQAIRQQSRTITWDSAADVLRMFGLGRSGEYYNALVERFKRVFCSTIHFGNEDESDGLLWERFHFMDKMKLWFNWNENDELPEDAQTIEGEPDGDLDPTNKIVLSEPFWKELQDHPIPIDLQAVRALTDSPGALDFYCWLTWRSFQLRETIQVPLEGESGLFNQLGMKKDQPTWKKRQTLKKWIKRVRSAWHDYGITLTDSGDYLVVPPGKAIHN